MLLPRRRIEGLLETPIAAATNQTRHIDRRGWRRGGDHRLLAGTSSEHAQRDDGDQMAHSVVRHRVRNFGLTAPVSATLGSMTRPASRSRLVTLVHAAIAMLAGVVGVSPAAAQPPVSDRFEKDIVAFEQRDIVSPPPKSEIVFVGSSTIRLWDTAAAFPDLKIINRGFGGSWLSEATQYAHRIIIPYEPRLVVLYAGDNDLAQAYMSENLAFEFEKFVRTIHAKLPQTRILFIGIKPSILRWLTDERFDMANDLIRKICEKDDRLAFVDFGGLMLGWDEKPRTELFVADGLHMTPAGYAIWNAAIRPYLLPPGGPSTGSEGRSTR